MIAIKVIAERAPTGQTATKMFSRFTLILLVQMLGVVALGQEVVKVQAEGRITYITMDQVYCDLGTNSGVAVGDTLRILRQNRELGLIVAMHVARKSSVCVPLVPVELFQLEDRVYLEKTIIIEDALPAVATKMAEVKVTDEDRSRPARIKQSGAISIRVSSDKYPSRTMTTRGIGTLNYRVQSTGPANFSLWVYGRSNLLDRNFNLYQTRLAIGEKEGRLYLQAGRVYSPDLAGVGATDGLLVSSTFRRRFKIGALVGFQPGLTSFSFNTDIVKMGGYARMAGKIKSLAARGTLALVGQYNNQSVDREFIYWNLRTNLKNVLSLGVHQTVDILRNNQLWGRGMLTPTSTQVSLSYHPLEKVVIHSRYTGRRQVIRLESARSIPDSLFNDALLSGLYNSIQWSHDKFGSIRIAGNIRTRKGQDKSSNVISGSYRSMTLKDRYVLRARLSRIRNQRLKGSRYVIGLTTTIPPAVSIYSEYTLYAYSFGVPGQDYAQHVVTTGLNWRNRGKVRYSLNGDFTKGKDFTKLFLYMRAHVRF